MSAKIEQLEREAQVLRAQNIALRKAADEVQTRSRELAEDLGDSHIDRKAVVAIDAPPIRASTAPSGGTSSTQTSFIQGKGYILGSATTEDAEGTTDELKQQLKAKWENEKKLQRRVTQVNLEKRLYIMCLFESYVHFNKIFIWYSSNIVLKSEWMKLMNFRIS